MEDRNSPTVQSAIAKAILMRRERNMKIIVTEADKEAKDKDEKVAPKKQSKAQDNKDAKDADTGPDLVPGTDKKPTPVDVDPELDDSAAIALVREAAKTDPTFHQTLSKLSTYLEKKQKHHSTAGGGDKHMSRVHSIISGHYGMAARDAGVALRAHKAGDYETRDSAVSSMTNFHRKAQKVSKAFSEEEFNSLGAIIEALED